MGASPALFSPSPGRRWSCTATTATTRATASDSSTATFRAATAPARKGFATAARPRSQATPGPTGAAFIATAPHGPRAPVGPAAAARAAALPRRRRTLLVGNKKVSAALESRGLRPRRCFRLFARAQAWRWSSVLTIFTPFMLSTFLGLSTFLPDNISTASAVCAE